MKFDCSSPTARSSYPLSTSDRYTFRLSIHSPINLWNILFLAGFVINRLNDCLMSCVLLVSPTLIWSIIFVENTYDEGCHYAVLSNFLLLPLFWTEMNFLRTLRHFRLTIWSPPDVACRNSTFCPPRLYLCVLCGSENKQRLFPYTALTDWFV